MAGNFIKCPRCELNYIDKTKQTYCDVCLAELKLGPSLKFADLEEDEDVETLELCPICKHNYIKFNQKMCDKCKIEKIFEKDNIEPEEDDEESWKEYLEENVDSSKDDDNDLSLSELQEEEEQENLDEDDDYDDYTAELDEINDDFDEEEMFDDEDDFDDEDEEDDDYED